MDYEKLVRQALRGVPRLALREVETNGLPGEHHFYITFDTTAEGVHIPASLRARFPESMTIVLQHQFWDLHAGDHSVCVTLAFGGVREPLEIPYDAMSSFVDPAGPFALEFDPKTQPELDMAEEEEGSLPDRAETPEAESTAEEADEDNDGATVVSLTDFRRK